SRWAIRDLLAVRALHSLLPHLPSSPLFPYTTLFRSSLVAAGFQPAAHAMVLHRAAPNWGRISTRLTTPSPRLVAFWTRLLVTPTPLPPVAVRSSQPSLVPQSHTSATLMR